MGQVPLTIHPTKPELGERVLVVPQSWSHLMNLGHHGNIVGKSEDVLDAYPERYGFPYWTNYTAGMPGWSYGLMVVRDGKLALGPSQWDSSD